MSTTTAHIVRNRTLAEQEQIRIKRLVIASRQAEATISEIDEVLQARFQSSHAYVLALVRFIDDTVGVVWAAYRGSVYAVHIDLPGAVHRALQRASPQVSLRVQGEVAKITVLDIYNEPQRFEWKLPTD